MDTFKARQSSDDAPQGCKLALDRSAALASTKQLGISRVCLSKPKSKYLRLPRALLMRHKDANLHLAKTSGTGFQKAAQCREQAAACHCIFACFFFVEKRIQGSTGPCWCATKMQTCTWPRGAALASKKKLSFLSKAISQRHDEMFIEKQRHI